MGVLVEGGKVLPLVLQKSADNVQVKVCEEFLQDLLKHQNYIKRFCV